MHTRCSPARDQRTDAVGEQGDDHRQHEHLFEHVQAQAPIGNLAER